MAVKIFVSYCHKDEAYKDEFIKFLSQMQRNGEIESWHDRDIVAGEEWHSEISFELEQADLICFLISSDFLASEYCYSVESARALEKHEEGTAVLVPVIIRHCDWSSSAFRSIQGLPKDAKPIKQWNDHDEAWMDVVAGIRSAIKSLDTMRIDPPKQEEIALSSLSEECKRWLEDTEIRFSHRRADTIHLSDIYVEQDLKLPVSDLDDLITTKSVTQLLRDEDYLLVIGDEQMGKSTLVKGVCIDLLNSGYLPVVVEGKQIGSAKLDRVIPDAISWQYENLSFEQLSESGRAVLVVDDFDQRPINNKHTSSFVKNSIAFFQKCLFTAHEPFKYVALEIEELEPFLVSEILPLGHVKRAELLEKWVSLGRSELIEEKDLYTEIDELKVRMNSLIRGNVVPAKPIYVLSLLQMFEATTPQNFELTTYGHCYQYLVYQALEKSNISSSEIDKYINVLTELSWAQFKNGQGLNSEQLRTFFKQYESKYVLNEKFPNIINKLLSVSLLIDRKDLISFKYAYVFYFFVAKKIAESYNTDKSFEAELDGLLDTLHREDSANIIIFISHHTKETWILEKLKQSLNDLYTDIDQATLSVDSLKFMSDFITGIPELVMEHKEITEERRKQEKKQDEIEINNSREELDEGDTSEILVQINKVFKGIEIAGQITRTRHASLPKDELLSIVRGAGSTGLRFLQYFIDLSDVAKDEIVKLIKSTIEENPAIEVEDIEKEARHTFLFITYSAIFGVMRKISASIGSKEADEIYDALEAEIDTPAVKLINEAISIQFKKRLDIKKLNELADEFRSNPTCMRMLKEIVIQHTYMFPVEYKDKQRVVEALGISMEGQRFMAMQKKLKI